MHFKITTKQGNVFLIMVQVLSELVWSYSATPFEHIQMTDKVT